MKKIIKSVIAMLACTAMLSSTFSTAFAYDKVKVSEAYINGSAAAITDAISLNAVYGQGFAVATMGEKTFAYMYDRTGSYDVSIRVFDITSGTASEVEDSTITVATSLSNVDANASTLDVYQKNDRNELYVRIGSYTRTYTIGEDGKLTVCTGLNSSGGIANSALLPGKAIVTAKNLNNDIYLYDYEKQSTAWLDKVTCVTSKTIFSGYTQRSTNLNDLAIREIENGYRVYASNLIGIAYADVTYVNNTWTYGSWIVTPELFDNSSDNMEAIMPGVTEDDIFAISKNGTKMYRISVGTNGKIEATFTPGSNERVRQAYMNNGKINVITDVNNSNVYEYLLNTDLSVARNQLQFASSGMKHSNYMNPNIYKNGDAVYMQLQDNKIYQATLSSFTTFNYGIISSDSEGALFNPANVSSTSSVSSAIAASLGVSSVTARGVWDVGVVGTKEVLYAFVQATVDSTVGYYLCAVDITDPGSVSVINTVKMMNQTNAGNDNGCEIRYSDGKLIIASGSQGAKVCNITSDGSVGSPVNMNARPNVSGNVFMDIIDNDVAVIGSVGGTTAFAYDIINDTCLTLISGSGNIRRIKISKTETGYLVSAITTTNSDLKLRAVPLSRNSSGTLEKGTEVVIDLPTKLNPALTNSDQDGFYLGDATDDDKVMLYVHNARLATANQSLGLASGYVVDITNETLTEDTTVTDKGDVCYSEVSGDHKLTLQSQIISGDSPNHVHKIGTVFVDGVTRATVDMTVINTNSYAKAMKYGNNLYMYDEASGIVHKIKLYNSRSELISSEATATQATAKFDLYNYNDADQDFTAIVAAYDINGTLLACDFEIYDNIDYWTEATVSLDLTDVTGVNKISAFVFDTMGNIAPMSYAYDVK